VSFVAQIETLRTLGRRLPRPLDLWVRAGGRTAFRLYLLARAAGACGPGGRRRVGKVWAVPPEERAKAAGMYWMGHPLVARRLHVKSSGRPDADCYVHLKEHLEQAGWRFPVDRALSLGCGHGALERGLASLGMAARYDAIDLSAAAIEDARRLAAAAGVENVEYRVGDLENADFPDGVFDLVLAHQSVHHIEDLDGLCRAVRRTLRPGGVFHLSEFVGPDRFQWTDAQLRHLNGFVATLPARCRRMPAGWLRPPVHRPTIAEMLAADPSEAIRSSAIVETVGRHFRIVEQRELGGALLHMGLSGIVQNFDAEDPEDVARLEAFFALEDQLMADGVIGSDFVTITAVRD
jgi:SAM-dependent methyltransferase